MGKRNASAPLLVCSLIAAIFFTVIAPVCLQAQPERIVVNLATGPDSFIVYQGTDAGLNKGDQYQVIGDGMVLGVMEIVEAGKNHAKAKLLPDFAGTLVEGAVFKIRPAGAGVGEVKPAKSSKKKAAEESEEEEAPTVEKEIQIVVNMDLGGGNFMTYTGSNAGLEKGDYDVMGASGAKLGGAKVTEAAKAYAKGSLDFEGWQEGQTVTLVKYAKAKPKKEPKEEEETAKEEKEPEKEEKKAEEPAVEKVEKPAPAAKWDWKKNPKAGVPDRNEHYSLVSIVRWENHSIGDALLYKTFVLGGTVKKSKNLNAAAFLTGAWNIGQSRLNSTLFGLSFSQPFPNDSTVSYGIYHSAVHRGPETGLADLGSDGVFLGYARTLLTEPDNSAYSLGATYYSDTKLGDNQFVNAQATWKKPVSPSSLLRVRCTYSWDIDASARKSNKYEARYDKSLTPKTSAGLAYLVIDSKQSRDDNKILRLDYRYMH